MKRKSIAVIAPLIMILFSSCGANYALIQHMNENSTQVQLRRNNFLVTNRVSGSAELDYVLMFGGMNRRRLYENAYANMLESANLLNSSKALINIVTEEHVGGLPPFYFKRTITVSAMVVEFTE
jgi:hypothetical protein